MAKDALSSEIEQVFEAARTSKPELEVARERFAEVVRARVESGIELSSLHISDLYLSLALAAEDPMAFGVFEEELGPDILRSLAKLSVYGADAAELQQRVRHKLFVAGEGGAAPKITTYSGKGPLRAWLRALVAHEAQSERRKLARDKSEPDTALAGLAATDDPELAEARARYAEPFREAFKGALESLSARDRTLLRLVHIDGLTVEQVAPMFDVHRVSVSRWLGKIRRDLLEGTRARLRAQLRLDDSELASVTRLCLSQIDVSIQRLLSA